MKILLDARLYGLENAGLGRYVMSLLAELGEIDNKNNYIILLRKKYFKSLNLPKNFIKIQFDYRHYSFMEQILLPVIIKRNNPDVVHFPHFNIPIFYFGKFIVTIHDMLMHKQKGIEATTLSPFNYYIKRLAYKFTFGLAVKRSSRIIVPSNAVKDDIASYYKVDENKMEVIYEG